MKKFIFLLFFLISFSSFSQIAQFKADYKASRSFDIFTQSFYEWGEWEESTALLSLNFKDDTFTIFTDEVKSFDIVDLLERSTNDNKDIIRFEAYDDERGPCVIEFTHFESEHLHIYIRWRTFQQVYQVKRL